jgi:hypothetical protein
MRRLRHLTFAALALMPGLWAITCAGSAPQAGDGEDGGAGAPADAAPRRRDLAHPDLRAPPDPATCPVGARDGCCPLLRNGGSDPDCPRLDCAHLTQGAPIALDAPLSPSRSGAGQVGMAWTGRELALAWTWAGNPGDYQVVFERRGSTGDVSYGPQQNPIPAAATPVVHGPTALAYEPARRAYVLSHTASAQRYAAIALSESGQTQWGMGLGVLCNALWLSVDAFSSGAQWIIGQQNMTCAGSTYWPRVDSVDYDGKNASSWALGDGKQPTQTLHGMFAYEPAANRLLSIYSRWTEATLGARYLNLSTGSLETGTDLRAGPPGSPFQHLGLAFDGARYGVVFETRPSYAAFNQYFQIYDPASGWVGAALQFAGPRAILPPSVVWTGDGFLVAMMSFDGPDTPLSDLTQFTANVYSFTPEGKLRESFPVDSGPALYPKLAWAGGRVALSWVRVGDGGGTTEHYLRYLSCP